MFSSSRYVFHTFFTHQRALNGARLQPPTNIIQNDPLDSAASQFVLIILIQRNLNNAFAYDLVPSTSVIAAALKAARRVNDFATAVRIFEGTFLMLFAPTTTCRCTIARRTV
jgi:hypothetical protein